FFFFFFFIFRRKSLFWVFFFFSSRRRHTRYWRDWSSDVCSSDLLDRDAGCFELQVNDPKYNCVRGGKTGWYWDETNTTSPNFHEYLAWATTLHAGANIPIL